MNRCKTCAFNDGGTCECPKIREDGYPYKDAQPDELVYSYDEGGTFFVGDDFGCVHHTAKPITEDTQ